MVECQNGKSFRSISLVIKLLKTIVCKVANYKAGCELVALKVARQTAYVTSARKIETSPNWTST